MSRHTQHNSTQQSQSTQRTKKRSHDTRILFKEPADTDVLRILLATDNHLGYAENDVIRCNDSFTTFNEILQLANDNQVDFVLLGGDLYHENKPSRNTQYQCNEILSKHVLGERAVNFQVISDQAVNFNTPNSYHANIYNENINIKLPIFTIHGNHDDPAGYGALSALDLLHQSLLVNYFGKQEKLDNIIVHPIVLSKGSTVVNLYGLGNIRDERLYRAFQAGQVKFIPNIVQSNNNNNDEKTDDNNTDNIFNLCVFHQNRTKHSVTDKNYIPETFLPKWLHFIHWGHEHECIPEPTLNSEMDFNVVQIGSSVATSLANGEAAKKHIAILEIKGASFRYNTIALNTVRPFDISDIKLSDVMTASDADIGTVEQILTEHIETRLIAVHSNPQYQNPDRPKLPLIRVRVDHTGFPRINTIRFGQRFVNKVANPDDLLLWQKRSTITHTTTNKATGAATNAAMELLQSSEPNAQPAIYELVSEIIQASSGLNVINDNSFSTAVQSYVEKKETSAISDMIDELIQKCSVSTKQYLNSVVTDGTTELSENDIIQAVQKHRSKTGATNNRTKKTLGINLADVDKTLRQVELNANSNKNTDLFGSDDEYVGSDSDTSTEQKSTRKRSTTTRGRGRGRGGKVTTTSSRARSKAIIDDSDTDESVVKHEPIVKTESHTCTQRKLPNTLSSGRNTTGTTQRTLTQTTINNNKRPRMGTLNMTQGDDDIIDMT